MGEDSSVVWFALISKRNILADTPSDDTQRMFMGNSSPVCKFVDPPRTGRIGTGKLITQELGTKKLGNLELGNSPPVCKFVDAPRTGMSGTPQFVVSTHPDIYNLSNTGARGISGKRTRSQ